MPREEKVFIIDRFEGDWAVIEYGSATFNFPRVLLPKGAGEGDVLEFSVAVNHFKSDLRRAGIKDLENELFK